MKFQVHFLLVASTAAPGVASPIRADGGDALHRAQASVLPALADLPGKGHGVLIAPQWVVTCAHSVAATRPGYVTLGGVQRRVDGAVVHPGYRALPKTMVDAAMQSGDAAPVMAFLTASDDIALLRLREPVFGIQPAMLYGGDAEASETIVLLGKGADGVATQATASGARRTVMRQARNVVTGVDDRWMVYRVDRPAIELPLDDAAERGEGAQAPAAHEGQWKLAGLAAWRQVQGDMRRPGKFGDSGVSVRISRYTAWLRDVMAVH